MRELKFRAWDKHYKAYVDLVAIQFGSNGLPLLVKYEAEDGRLFTIPAHIFIVEQYTGLKDKNGKEIYEGDIVKWSYYTTIHREEKRYSNITVGWYSGENDFYPYSTDSGFSLPQSEDGYEIIGNVHENPELLEGE